MDGICDKVVDLIIPILKGSNSDTLVEGKPNRVNYKRIGIDYKITIKKIEARDNIPEIYTIYESNTDNNNKLDITICYNNRDMNDLKIISIKFDKSRSSLKRKNNTNSKNGNESERFDSGESFESSETTRNKRPRCYSESYIRKEEESFDFDKMVSATKTRNYILDDGILDFLDYYSKNPKKHSLTFNEIVGFDSGYNTRSKNYSTNIQKINHGSEILGDMIKEEGIKYEKKVIDEMKDMVIEMNKLNLTSSNDSINFVSIDSNFDISKNFEITKRYLENGAHILYQPVLVNSSDNTFGCPDLLVRSDILNKFFNNEYITPELEDRFARERRGEKYFYVVIDIKHSHLEFNADCRTMRNTETIKPYKSQLCVYNNAISKIQKFDPKIALVLGKSYTLKNTKYTNYFDKLGVIDFETRDSEYVNKTIDAINWIRRIREEGKYWVLDPIPSVKELFPRMNNEKDGKWKVIKQRVSDNIGEITSVYYCGVKERVSAHSNNIFNWRDDRLNSGVMGFNTDSKSKIPSTIDKILSINRQSEYNILPLNIRTKLIGNLDWRTVKNSSFEFYLDFETMNSNFIDNSISSDNSIESVIIFQIGIGYLNSNNKWIYKPFVAKNKSFEGEKEMFQNFFNYINTTMDSLSDTNRERFNGRYHFVHWYPHERICYDKVKYKLNLPNVTYMDLSKLFRDEPIVVKGSLRFKLKSVSKALYENRLITTAWDYSSECNSGLAAMALANKLYNEVTEVTEKNEIMKEIIKYNEVDCKVLWDILRYLRENH